MLPFIIAILLWPIVTFGSIRLFSILLMPVFNRIYSKFDTKYSLISADLFQAISLILSQIILIFIVKFIYNQFQTNITGLLAIPFGLFYLIFGPRWLLDFYLQQKNEPWKDITIGERHLAWSWIVGLGFGWIISTIMLIN